QVPESGPAPLTLHRRGHRAGPDRRHLLSHRAAGELRLVRGALPGLHRQALRRLVPGLGGASRAAGRQSRPEAGVIMLALLLAALAAPSDSLVVTPEWLAAHRSDPGLVILHVAMDRADYERGHIPGARWVNPHDLLTMGPPGSELPSAEHIDSVLSGLG